MRLCGCLSSSLFCRHKIDLIESDEDMVDCILHFDLALKVSPHRRYNFLLLFLVPNGVDEH